MNGSTKRWREYEEFLLSGLWHVHTNLTDGVQPPERVVEFAAEQRFPLVGIVEHVREKPTYDFESLYSRAKRAAADATETAAGASGTAANAGGNAVNASGDAANAGGSAVDRPLECVVGCEAKVTDVDGRLDVSDEVLDRADVVYAAYHGTPFSQEEYVESVLATLENPNVDVWAHPFSYPSRAGFEVTEDDVDRILETLVEENVLFERNLSRPPSALSRPLRSTRLPTVVGYDLHDVRAWTGGTLARSRR